MDVLSSALAADGVRNMVFGRFEMTGAWGVAFSRAEGRMPFYLVTSGEGWLEVAGAPGRRLMAGDFVLLSRGQAHALTDAEGTAAVPLAAARFSCDEKQTCQPGGVFRLGRSGAAATFVAGSFAGDRAEHAALDAMPALVHLNAADGSRSKGLESCLDLISREMATGAPGSELIVSRLVDVLLVEIARSQIAQSPTRAPGLLMGLGDQRISDALSVMHRNQEAAWTLESLAAHVSMSRSAFASLFARTLGEPPLTYLTRWRMTEAARLLRTERTAIAEIASRVGYHAEAAFHKAFKRVIGTPPGQYRRRSGP